jgi:hypothetical protein
MAEKDCMAILAMRSLQCGVVTAANPMSWLLCKRCCISIIWRIAMKKLLIVITPLLILGSAYPAFAAGNNKVQTRSEQIQACFRMHGQLMNQ